MCVYLWTCNCDDFEHFHGKQGNHGATANWRRQELVIYIINNIVIHQHMKIQFWNEYAICAIWSRLQKKKRRTKEEYILFKYNITMFTYKSPLIPCIFVRGVEVYIHDMISLYIVYVLYLYHLYFHLSNDDSN